MKLKLIIAIGCLIIGIIIGFIIYLLFFHITSDFFKFRIIDIINIIFYSIIAILFGYYMNLKYQNSYKRKNLSIEFLEDIKNIIGDDEFIREFENYDDNSKKSILMKKRGISNKIALLKSMKKDGNKDYRLKLERLNELFMKLANLTTGEEWGKSYSEDKIKKIQNIVSKMIFVIDELKTLIYA